AEVILPALESSLLELIEATLDGNLAQTITRQRPGAFVGVVLASGGYPAAQFPTGFPIHGVGNQGQDTQVFVGGVKAGEQPGELLTNGGRVAVVVAHGPDLPTAVELAYAEAELVYFQDKYVRSDIGQRPAPLLETSAY
ncbi:MAG: phosphoribosylamine--glycine ligase, partial [Hymenobacter sp.]